MFYFLMIQLLGREQNDSLSPSIWRRLQFNLSEPALLRVASSQDIAAAATPMKKFGNRSDTPMEACDPSRDPGCRVHRRPGGWSPTLQDAERLFQEKLQFAEIESNLVFLRN
jgi:hypothetical protein